MIKHKILQQVHQALQEASSEFNGWNPDPEEGIGLRLERPRNPDHGDYALNISFLSRFIKQAPPQIAATLKKTLEAANTCFFDVTVVGAYLNFTLQPAILMETMVDLLHADSPGFNHSQQGQNILLEYVSANPTGPLHIGHGRWAALGDSLARLLRHCDAQVTTEFYINDAGVQMNNIAASLMHRAMAQLQSEGLLPQNCPLPETLPYPGEYVIDLAQQYLADPTRKATLTDNLKRLLESVIEGDKKSQFEKSGEALSEDAVARFRENIAQLTASPEHGFATYCKKTLLKEQQDLLEKIRVHFDYWVSEKEDLYTDKGISNSSAQTGPNKIEKTLKKLIEKEVTYEADNALWFASSRFGDEKDRVLRKSDAQFTYLMPDIAYHDDKFSRPESYNRILNIWGADHHGYIPRMRGAIEALGHDANQFEVLLGQLVNLIVDGERTRMGKRRKMLTLEDVVEEVGIDATRFWMVSKSSDSTLDFDVDLAASATQDNPVFYVQYAHARCCSILRNAIQPMPDVAQGEMVAALLQEETLNQFEKGLDAEKLSSLWTSLTEPQEKAVLKQLILLLDAFEDMTADAARMRAPHFLTQYTKDLAAQFHSFYGVCRILTPDPAVTLPRLMLIRLLQKTLSQALELLGVSAPEKM